jgi:hypothetical protein
VGALLTASRTTGDSDSRKCSSTTIEAGRCSQGGIGPFGEVFWGMHGFGIEHQELETREKRFLPSESAIGHIGYLDVKTRSCPGFEYKQASGVIAGAG